MAVPAVQVVVEKKNNWPCAHLWFSSFGWCPAEG